MSYRGWLIASVTAAVLLVIAIVLATRQSPIDGGEPEPALKVSPVAPQPARKDVADSLSGEMLRSALEELCADRAVQAGDDAEDSGDTNTRLEPFDQWQQQLLSRLSVSPTPEHLVLAALLDEESATRIDLVGRAVSLNPHDAFTLWNAVHICSDEHEATGCPLRDWERRLLQGDGQNSETWIRVAANRHQARDLVGALEALQRAATSAETRAYWTETIEMAERGLAVAGDRSFPERATMAFGIAASTLPDYGDYWNMCKAQSATDVEWAYACLRYGETLENQGKTDIGTAIGLGIQMLALEALGDEDAHAGVERRKATRSRQWAQWGADKVSVAEQLVTSTPARFSSYLAAVRRHGEAGARALIVDEIDRLLQREPELVCASEP